MSFFSVNPKHIGAFSTFTWMQNLCHDRNQALVFAVITTSSLLWNWWTPTCCFSRSDRW